MCVLGQELARRCGIDGPRATMYRAVYQGAGGQGRKSSARGQTGPAAGDPPGRGAGARAQHQRTQTLNRINTRKKAWGELQRHTPNNDEERRVTVVSMPVTRPGGERHNDCSRPRHKVSLEQGGGERHKSTTHYRQGGRQSNGHRTHSSRGGGTHARAGEGTMHIAQQTQTAQGGRFGLRNC